MKTYLLPVLTLALASVAPLVDAVAAPTRLADGSLLDFYDRIPGKHFAGFGGVNRRSLLKRKGAIVDYKNKFIEIPGNPVSGDDDPNQLRALQIKLLPRNPNEDWVVVSRVMWKQNRMPGTLNFYHGYSDDGGLRTASDDFFPYKLKKYPKFYENAYLPRRGMTIKIRTPAGDTGGPNFTYRPNARATEKSWVRTETPSD